MPTTRDRLIDAALKRFYRDGFRNVGIESIFNDVGISKTAFYKHFDSKETLIAAVLTERSALLRETLLKTIRSRGGDDPRAQVAALFDVVESVTEADGYQGCIFVNAAMEYPQRHEPAHIVSAENKRAVEAIISEIVAAAGADDPQAAAEELCLIMEGAYVARQITGNLQSVNVARSVAEAVLMRRCPARQ